MLSAYDQQGSLMIAWEVTKMQGPFFCPECEKQVVVKKGSFKIHHFAHQPSATCTYGTGESEEHRRAKYRIYCALRRHPDVTKLAVERPLKEVRPDVSFCWQGKDYVAIELQISPISPDEIARRTQIYTSKKIAVLWTIPHRDDISCLTPYRPQIWERYLHALYFGKVYYWLAGDELYPIHFEPVSNTELRYVYNEEKERVRLQFVDRFSSVLKNVRSSEFVRITDLRQVWRPARQIGDFKLPNVRLWVLPKEKSD
jgi:competence protein CoiA